MSSISSLRSRLSAPARRTAACAVTAAALALVGLPGPAASAAAAPLFGESVQFQPGETWTAALARSEATYGHLGAVRVFQGVPDPRILATLGPRSGVVSFDLPPAQVLSGADDDQFRAFFAAAPTDHPTWWSYEHEADVAWASGKLPDLAALRAAWDHVATLARQSGNPLLRATAIVVGWTADPASHRDVRAFLPDDLGLLDVLGFDNYDGAWTRRGSYGDPSAAIALDRAAADALGKPFAVPEYGSLVVGTDTQGRADWLRHFAVDAAAAGAQFVCYYNSDAYGTTDDYRLTDAPSRQALRDVVAGTPVTAPATPADPTVAPGAGALAVSWPQPDDHGAALTGAVVTATDVATGAVAGTVVSTGPASAAVTGLADGRAYAVRVAVTSSAGTSAPSGAVTAVPGGGLTAPAAPVPGVVTASDGGATATWSTSSWAAAGADGGSAVTAVTATAVDDATGTRTVASAAPSTGSVTIAGLQDGHSYTIELGATGAFGRSADVAAGTAVPFAAPGAPGTPVLVPGNGSVTARWSAPATDGGRPVSAWLLRAYGRAGALLASATVPAAAGPDPATATLTGLANGRPVTLTVTALNGLTGPASPHSAPAVPATVPAAPLAHGYGGSATDADVSATAWWSWPSTTGGLPVTGYLVTTYALGDAVPVQVSPLLPVGTARSLRVTGLTPGAQYAFVVQAVNAAGASLPSAPSEPVTAR